VIIEVFERFIESIIDNPEYTEPPPLLHINVIGSFVFNVSKYNNCADIIFAIWSVTVPVTYIIFSFINDDKIFKIDDETKNITVDYPIQYNKNHSFIPPGLAFGLDEQPDKIPIDIYYSSIYHSLAQLCVYVFLRKQIKDEEDYDKVAGPFIYTSLYWCLKRCLDKDENKRILLYV